MWTRSPKIAGESISHVFQKMGQIVKRREVKILPISVLGVCFVLTGCGLPSPTYGTNKVVSLQFFEDIANLFLLMPTDNSDQLVMEPHPKLVIPKPSARVVLPLPQKDRPQDDSLSKAKALKKRHNGGEAPVFFKKVSSVDEYAGAIDLESISRLSAGQRREYLRLQKAQVGSAKYRQYLAEPPLSYRQPAKIAPVGKATIGTKR